MVRTKTTVRGKDPLKQMKAIKRASAFTLNQLAERDNAEASKLLKHHLTVRTPRFFEPATTNKKTTAGFKLTTARVGSPIAKQYSLAGSLQRPRFTGWREQQFGKKPTGSRVPTIKGRQGNESKVFKRSYRKDRVDGAPVDTDFGQGQNGTTIMLRKLQREKYTGPFKITNHSKLPPGLYKFTGRTPKKGLRKIVRLEAYGVKKKPVKKFKWKTNAQKVNNSRIAQKEYNKQYKRMVG